MTIKNNKKLVIIIALVALLTVGGVAGYFVMSRKDAEPSSLDNSNTLLDELSIVDMPPPEGIDANQLEQSAPKLDEQLPSGTVSPHTVATDSNNFTDKTIFVRGLITETAPGEYIISSQNASEEQALRLAGDSEAIKPHASSRFGDTVKFADPVTVEGKLTFSEKYQSIVLEIISIKQ